jgi:hypothetical protein
VGGLPELGELAAEEITEHKVEEAESTALRGAAKGVAAGGAMAGAAAALLQSRHHSVPKQTGSLRRRIGRDKGSRPRGGGKEQPFRKAAVPVGRDLLLHLRRPFP